MRTVQMLLACLPGPRQVSGRTRIRARIIWAIVVVDVALGIAAFAAWDLLRAWETGEWFVVWFSATTVFTILAAILIGYPLLRGPYLRLRSLSSALVHAAASEDERLAPVATQQPAIETPQTRADNLSLRVSRSFDGSMQSQRMAVSLVIFGFVLVFAFAGFVSGMARQTVSQTSSGMSAVVGLVTVMLVVIAFPLLILATVLVRGRRGVTVTVDERGVEWKRRRWARQRVTRISCQSIRSFFQITYQAPLASMWMRPTTISSTTYVVDGGDDLLTWSVSPSSGDEEAEASEILAREIAIRTRLPLRDLSVLAEDLARTGGYAPRVVAARVRPGTEGTAAPFITVIGQDAATAKRAITRSRRIALLTASLLVVTFGLLSGGAFWLHSYQQHYLASLPARVHAETPLYTDALSYDDGQWPAAQLSTTSAAQATWVDSAYQLSGAPGHGIHSWRAPFYSNVAVEVTAEQLSAAPAGSADGVGLTVRAGEDPLKMTIFLVNPTGHWGLYSYDETSTYYGSYSHLLVGGFSPAIHEGLGQENRLLVVAHGYLYLCYVNGVFVGSFFDNLHTTYSYGSAGVFVNDGAFTGAFKNFAIYPVQPPSSLWWVV